MLEKEILRLRILLEKETNKEIRKILREQKKSLERIRQMVGSMYMEYGEDLHMSDIQKRATERAFKEELEEVHGSLTTSEIAVVSGLLYMMFSEGYYRTAYTLDKGVEASININYNIRREEFVRAIVNANFQGQTFSNRIWNNQAKLINELYEIIGTGIYEGHSIDKMSKLIKDRFGVSAYNSTRLARTESARIVSEAQDEIYRNSGLVNRVMYVATLDNRTSQICQERDSSIWELSDLSRPTLPAHPNCRSTYIPVMLNWNPTRRRDNQAKENIDFTSYESWAKDNNVN